MSTTTVRARQEGEIKRVGRSNGRENRWTPSARKNALRRAAVESMPARALVAEDDDDMRRLVVRALRDEGFDVVDVRSGWALLEYLGARIFDGRRDPPLDLIVSDVRMHGVTGLEVLAGLRQTNWSTPVILITAFGDAKLHAEARRLGAFVFDKPFDFNDLRRLARTMAGS
jgi:DNA-binding response OmpR family regulator